ncbi:hypothetical protein PROPHIGD51-1_35 [Mycobacterium phage prophiGD51-1]|nr:hypothetical protein PROPHIGD51-1_35 [Mycobacterium phage prophiGD51-1]
MTERLGLAVAIATLIVNLWMVVQNRKPRKSRKRGRHRR